LKQILLAITAFCCHFLLVQFGSLFTIPFGFASLIWPVTGVFLGLYFLFGRAILVATFFSTLVTLYQQNLTIIPLPNYAIIIIASASVLQFIISKKLVSHFFTLPVKTHFQSEIIKFLLLTGPVSSFVSTTIIIVTLWKYLNLPYDVLLYIWVAKWVGDFISIIFITPVTLFLMDNKYVVKAKRPYAAIATSFLVLSIISFIYILNSVNKYTTKEQHFINLTPQFIEQINIAQSQIKQNLTALDGLFQASDSVTREEFKSFVQKLDQSDIQTKAIAWLPLINEDERSVFEEKLSDDGLGKYIKREINNDFMRAPVKKFYMPILYTEPMKDNAASIGLDVSTHPSIESTVYKAIHKNTYIITPLLSLTQQKNKFTGVIVYYPIYKGEPSNRIENLKGLVEMVIDLRSLLEEIHAHVKNEDYTYHLTFGKDNVVAHSKYHKGMFNYSIDINLFDKKGVVSFSSTDKFEKKLIDWTGIILILVGCSVGIVCVMLVFLIISFNYSLRRKVNEKTAELQKNNEKLVSANRAKNLFLANISHEYRTPLNAIIGFTEIAQREVTDDVAFDYLSKISHSSNILLNIVNDVLDISKMQAGELNLENRSFNPTVETLSVIEMLNGKAKEKSINITSEMSQSFDSWISGDDFRFKQILINLLNNAIKFTSEGFITIKGESEIIDGTNVLTISVKDTGIGIEKEQQKHIFQAFAQAESSTTRKYGGTGLGLSIVKQLCTLMNGDITVKSQAGEGSEFTLKLKLEQATEPEKTSTFTKEIHPQSSFNEFTILVVEDNKINQVIVQKQLLSLGAKSYLADDGQQALNYLEDHKPDLILMDLQMPNMDGFTAASLIKNNNKLKNIPIVILSASVGKEDKEKAAELGIEDFINKPFQQSDIQFVLNKYLNESTSK
jgi:signal transduction histidine kinase/CheY-like chemotaxis protein